MAKKKKNNVNQIEDNINNLTDTLEKLTSSLGPLMAFSDLGKNLNKLKTTIPKPNSENEGETCIHGNAWHSECSECNGLSITDDIFALVTQYKDDAKLGAAVRELYKLHTSDSDDTEE